MATVQVGSVVSAGSKAAPKPGEAAGASDGRAYFGVWRLVDFFLPARDPAGSLELERRSRLTIVVGFFGALATFGALQFVTELASTWIRMASYGLGFVFAAVPLMVKRGIALYPLQLGMIVTMAGYSIYLAWATVGMDTGFAFIAFMVPLLAVLMAGLRTAIGFTALLCVAFAAIAVASTSGLAPRVLPDPEAVAHWNLWACTIAVVSMLAIAWTYDSLRLQALEELAASRAREHALHERQHEMDRAFRRELESQVEARTAELARSEASLRNAERLASLGTLAAGVAHQINNPLGSILIASQFAISQSDDAEQTRVWREALEQNAREAGRCGQIVKSLLKFSAGESDEKTVCDLNRLVAQALGPILRRPLDGATIEETLTSDPLPIAASEIAIEQVVVNLVENALQAGEGRPNRIRVVSRRRASWAELEISDTGRGIDEADRSRIFDPFFTSRLENGGTGLGLSVVYGILRDHGGTVEVDSRPGEGSRFSCQIPLAG